VNWEYVRVLKNGETVSIDGTHLGHNLPDKYGRRYCINLVSIAGNPVPPNFIEEKADL
jgi:peptide methionine sulfoxide reductase MsrB